MVGGIITPLAILLADRNGSYIYLALCVATLYDHLISVDLEVDFIWKRPKFSLAQILFIINRYIGDIVLLYITIALIMQANPDDAVNHTRSEVDQCQLNASSKIRKLISLELEPGGMLASLSMWGGAIVTWTMQGIMVIRINIMYRDSVLIKAVQLAFFAVEILTMTIMQAAVPGQLVNLTCAVSVYPGWYEWLWGPILSFEILMLALSIWSGYLHYREYSAKAPVIFSEDGTTLVYVMMRDSISFPFVSVVLVVINFMGWNHLSLAASQANTAVMIFAPRILGCRLVLNLREVYYRPFGDEYSRDYANAILPLKFVESSTSSDTSIL